MGSGWDEPTSGERDGNWRKNSTPPTQRQSKIAMLNGLMLLYPDNRLTPDEWKIRLKAYVEELEMFPPGLLEQAVRLGRKAWKFFPSIPEILEQISAVQSQSAGTGGMGFLGWDRYKAWLQATGRPTSRPYSPEQQAHWLEKIPRDEMIRLGTPEMGSRRD